MATAACLGAGLLVVLPAFAAARQGNPGDPPRATPELGAFAFTNGSGTKLLVVGGPAGSLRPFSDSPSLAEGRRLYAPIRTAFCSDGRSHPISFERMQQDDGTGRGRQSHFTFDHLEGLVFALKGGSSLSEGATCFLAADSFAQSLSVTATDSLRPRTWPPEMPACDAQLAVRIASYRRRAVAGCWRLVAPRAPQAPVVVAVLFARQGNDGLASIVVVDDTRLIFADQPGDYSREGSVWRVDDDGKFDPAWLNVLLLARRGTKAILAFGWIGAEGTVLRLLESDGDRFRELLRDYWYQAPI
jgi:hypothetical protein